MAFLGSQLNTGVLSEISPLWLGQNSSQYCATSGVISIMLSDPAHTQPNCWPRTWGEFPYRQTSDTLFLFPFFCYPVLQTLASLAPQNSSFCLFTSVKPLFHSFQFLLLCQKRASKLKARQSLVLHVVSLKDHKLVMPFVPCPKIIASYILSSFTVVYNKKKTLVPRGKYSVMFKSV